MTMKLWAKTKEYSEGKYLVVRRDGTIPEWAHFVMGGNDPCVPPALRAYADVAEKRGFDPEYVASIPRKMNGLRTGSGRGISLQFSISVTPSSPCLQACWAE
jgi:hypothetical protein